MKKRILYGSGVVLLAILSALVVWQGSFAIDLGGPPSAQQTYILWAVSTLIFILTITLGFMLVRNGVKLYIERRAGHEGSRIKTKLVAGALALSIMPVFFLVAFSISILNHNVNKWFSSPTESVLHNLSEVSASFRDEVQKRANAQAALLARAPELREYLLTGRRPALFDAAYCEARDIEEAWLQDAAGDYQEICTAPRKRETAAERPPRRLSGRAELSLSEAAAAAGNTASAAVIVRATMPVDLAAKQDAIDADVRKFAQLASNRREFRATYLLLMTLITLFILFVATWIALFLSRQISGPISALLEAARQLGQGNLGYRIPTKGIDELGTLIHRFNEMAEEIQANRAEIERRRNFTEAILENIPTGVISLSADRRIVRVNRALSQILAVESARASHLEELFPEEEARELHYLMNRARRTGQASSQIEIKKDGATLHLAVTVAAIEGRDNPGFVIVIEDTSELLRAQKAAAWHEVARRIAHEMKNPLTPIGISAERIARQLEKLESSGNAAAVPQEVLRILRECSLTISAEVQSVKTLVDEFSQFARFPEARLVRSNLNEVVEAALAVFNGRLSGIELVKDLAPDLPPVMLDPEQFRRAIVNLADNAAEAMQDSAFRQLTIRSQATGDGVELCIADTGCGISPEDREKLFLPYFSTKDRGTGLGLAIVHHIVSEHGGHIRVEDNKPCGARFLIELPAAPPETAAEKTQPVTAEAQP
jgi:two-component system nitrogen regulation sensor histidine kinase NtrY